MRTNLSRLQFLPVLATLALAACMPESTQVADPQTSQPQTDRTPGVYMGPQELIVAGLAREADEKPVRVAKREVSGPQAGLSKAAAGAREYLTFDDPEALELIPSDGYVRNKILGARGYQQDVGGTKMIVWMSEGPGKGFAPPINPGRGFVATDSFSYQLDWSFKCIRSDGTGGMVRHRGSCGSIPSTLDRWAYSEQGNTWFAIKGQRGGEWDRFDLHYLEVLGEMPIQLWYHGRGGWRFYAALAPGAWEFQVPVDLDEIQIRAWDSGFWSRYAVDDIQVSLR